MRHGAAEVVSFRIALPVVWTGDRCRHHGGPTVCVCVACPGLWCEDLEQDSVRGSVQPPLSCRSADGSSICSSSF